MELNSLMLGTTYPADGVQRIYRERNRRAIAKLHEQLDLLKASIGRYNIDRNPGELIALRDRFRAEVAAEERARRIASGEQIANKLKVRF